MQKLLWTLFFTTCLLSPQLFANTQKQLKQQELEQLNQKISDLKSNLKKQQSKHNKQTADLAEIEKKIGKNQNAIITIEKSLTSLENEKQQLLSKQQDLQNDQRELKKQMETLFLDLYRQGQQTWLKTLLTETNPANFSRKLKYVEFINQSQRNTLQSFYDNQNKLNQTILDINDKTQATKTEQLNLSKTQQSLLANQQDRKKEVAKLKKSISSSQKEIQISEQNQQQLKELIEKMILTLSNQDLGLQDTQFDKLQGKLRWPVKSRSKNRFGAKTPTGRKWTGWEMPTDSGTQVQVIASGRVIFSDWLRGFGLLIIVDHGDGYLSLYGRNQSLLKEEGEWVSANETISIVGVSGGYEKSALYFEIRKNSKPQNPANWLSKSIK